MKKYFPGVTLLELTVLESDTDSHGVKVEMKYEIDEGVYKTFDSITINL